MASGTKYVVRQASFNDFEGTLKLIESFSDESIKEYVGEINNQCIIQLLKQAFATSFVLTFEGKIVGVVGGLISFSPFTGKPMYQEIIWYVESKHRRYGIRLLKHIESYCRERGIKHIIFGYMQNLHAEKMEKFYEKFGFKKMEVQFIKELEDE